MQMALLSDFFTDFKDVERIEICYKSLGLTTDGKACIKFYVVPLPNVNCTLDKTSVRQTDDVCCNCSVGNSTWTYRIYCKSLHLIPIVLLS